MMYDKEHMTIMSSVVLEGQWGNEAPSGPRIHWWKKQSGRGPSRIMTYGTGCSRWVLPSIITDDPEYVTCEDCLQIMTGGKKDE